MSKKIAGRESTTYLRAWLHEHQLNPYPTKGEKIMLALVTRMNLTQISTWFANARRRLKKENRIIWCPRLRNQMTSSRESRYRRDKSETDGDILLRDCFRDNPVRTTRAADDLSKSVPVERPNQVLSNQIVSQFTSPKDVDQTAPYELLTGDFTRLSQGCDNSVIQQQIYDPEKLTENHDPKFDCLVGSCYLSLNQECHEIRCNSAIGYQPRDGLTIVEDGQAHSSEASCLSQVRRKLAKSTNAENGDHHIEGCSVDVASERQKRKFWSILENLEQK